MLTRSVIDRAFTSVLVEAGRLLPHVDVTSCRREVRSVDEALGRLCTAIDDPNRTSLPIDRLAREAFMAALALAQLLAGACSANTRTTAALDLAQHAVGQLLDVLEPYVTYQDREARRVLLDGEPLDTALERMFCG